MTEKKPNFTQGEIGEKFKTGVKRVKNTIPETNRPLSRKPPLPNSDLDKAQKVETSLQNLLKSVSDLTILNGRYKIVIADTAAIMKKQLLDQGHSPETVEKAVDSYMKRVEFILKGGKVNV